MLRGTISLFLLYVTSFGLAYAQLQQGCIGFSGNISLGDLVQCSDGSYGGVGLWSGMNTRYCEVLKLDANGSFLWSEKIPYDNTDASYATATPDGGFTVGCEMEEFYVLVIKVAADGMVEWYTTIRRYYTVLHTTGITRTADGGYAVSGWLRYEGAVYKNAFVCKLSAQGQVEWLREYNWGDTATLLSGKILETQNHDLVVVGHIQQNAEGYRGFVLRLDPSGNVVWCELGPGSIYLDAANIGTSDIVIGGDLDGDIQAARLDSTGNTVWSARVGSGTVEVFRGLTVTQDSSVVLTGSWNYDDVTSSHMYVVKLAQDGVLKWTRILGLSDASIAEEVVATPDGGTALVGDWVDSDTPALMMQLDSNGLPCPLCGVDSGGVANVDTVAFEPLLTNMISGAFVSNHDVWIDGVPNSGAVPICTVVGVPTEARLAEHIALAPVPAHDVVQVTLPQAWLREGPLTLTLVDAMGRVVRTHGTRTTSDALDLQGCAPGLYHVLVSGRGGVMDRMACVVE